MALLQVLILIFVANGAPVLATRFFPRLLAVPVDGGRRAADGRPLLGPSKTWRGLVASLSVTALVAPLLELPWWLGALAAVTAMLGDLLSSFCKRRLGLASSDQAAGLDQVPESLLPALALSPWLGLDASEVLAAVALFFALGLALSELLYQMGLRKRPY